MRPSMLLRSVWRHKWRIVLAALLIGGAFYLRARTQPETYAAEARVTVSGPSGADELESAARVVADLVPSTAVVTAGANRAGVEAPVAELRDRLSARTESGHAVVTATGLTPSDAAALAQGVAEAAADAFEADRAAAAAEVKARIDAEIDELTERLDNPLLTDSERETITKRRDALLREAAAVELQPAARARLVAPARADRRPVSPTPLRDAAAAFALALLANATLAVAVEALSDRFPSTATEAEVAKATGLPVLAAIPRKAGTEAVEGVRALRTNLMFVSTPERLRSLAIVGPDRRVGRSFLAERLAREAAALDVVVVLLDADARNPSLHERLGTSRSPGLTEVLTGSVALELAVRELDNGVRFIPAGAAVDDLPALLGAGPFTELLAKLSWAELVVVDTPVAGPTGDAVSAAARCDATLVVVDALATRRRDARALVERLRQTDAVLLGVVVNRVRS